MLGNLASPFQYIPNDFKQKAQNVKFCAKVVAKRQVSNFFTPKTGLLMLDSVIVLDAVRLGGSGV